MDQMGKSLDNFYITFTSIVNLFSLLVGKGKFTIINPIVNLCMFLYRFVNLILMTILHLELEEFFLSNTHNVIKD